MHGHLNVKSHKQTETSEDGLDFKHILRTLFSLVMLVIDTNPCSLTPVTALGYVRTEH